MKTILFVSFMLCSFALVSVYLLPLTTAQENSKTEGLIPLQQTFVTEDLSKIFIPDEHQSGDELFSFVGLKTEGESATAASVASVGEQAVYINFNALTFDSSERIRIPLFDGKTYQAIRSEKEGFEWRGLNDYTWRGFINGKNEWSVTLTIKDGAVAGLITSPKGLYEILPQKDSRHILLKVDQSRAPYCGSGMKSPNSDENKYEAAATTPITDFGQTQLAPQDTGTQIDVMIVYTAAVRNSLGGTTQAQAFAQQAVDSTNTAYLLSGINPRLRLVHSQEINYTESGSTATFSNMNNDLTNLDYNQTVKNLRDYYKADHVTLFVKYTTIPTLADVGGISYGMHKSSFSYGYADDSLSVVERSWAVADYAFAHELGHNQGAEHNVQNVNLPADQLVYPYAYGHRVANTFKTIMSSGDSPIYPRIGYFSTPNRTWSGQPIGIANQRDNVRVINNTAYTVANFKDTSGCSFRAGEGRYADELTAFQYAYVTGGSSSLGCPNALVRTDGFTSFAGTQGYYQTTANGEILYHNSNSRLGQAFAIVNPLRAKWANYTFGRTHPLGYPIGFVSSNNAPSCFGTQNRYQSFEGGSLVQHLSGSRNGQVFEVHGAIHSRWSSSGFAGCPLGLPISDEYISNGRARSDFEGGYITTVDGVNYQIFPYSTSCTYQISSTSQSLGSGSGTGSVAVTAGSGCTWTAISNAPWITVTSGGNRNGNGTVNFSVEQNTGSSRTGTITIAGKTFTVTQSGGTTGCSSPSTIGFGQTLTGNLQSGDCLRNSRFYDAYTFSGTAQQKIFIRLNSTHFDTYLYLFKGNFPGGGLWYSDDDGGGGYNSRIPAYSGYVTLPSAGTYTILATSYNAGATGNYTLLLDRPLILTIDPTKTISCDFDSDRKTDFAVYRPSNGVWYFQSSTKNGFDAVQFGNSTDKITPADYDGDGKADIAVFRDGNWYLQRSTDGYASVQFGSTGDVPVPADFDGDEKAELAVYRPSNGTWYVLNLTNNNFNAVQFGIPTDKPVAADYDGDGKSDYAVYRPEIGTWYIMGSRDGFAAIQFGISTDKPVVGDYDGDGKADQAVYRSSNGVWYLLRSNQGFAGIQFGIPTDLPVPGDYDGDGKTDIAVWRQDGGVFYILRSNGNQFSAFQFGTNGDLPVASAFVR